MTAKSHAPRGRHGAAALPQRSTGPLARPRLRGRAQAGGTVIGLLLGIVLGLGIAVGTAMMVNTASNPFINAAIKPADQTITAETEAEAGRADPEALPDPNRIMTHVRNAAPASAAESGVATVDAPVLGNGPGAVVDPLGRIIAGTSGGTAPVVAAAPVPANLPQASYLLQAGAFRNQREAETLRGKLARTGFDANIAEGDLAGAPIYRVRVGPFSGLDNMNTARQRLADSGIEATVLRLR